MQSWEFLRRLQRAANEVWTSLKLKKRTHVVRDWNTLKRNVEIRPSESSIGGLRKLSIHVQGVDAVSRKKWDFSKEEESAKFLEDVDRPGPPVSWVHCQCQRRPDSTHLSVAACTRQHRRRRPYVLHVPLGCDVDENKELEKLLDKAHGNMFLMRSGSVVTNWDRMQAELEREDVDVEHVKNRVVKLTVTMS